MATMKMPCAVGSGGNETQLFTQGPFTNNSGVTTYNIGFEADGLILTLGKQCTFLYDKEKSTTNAYEYQASNTPKSTISVVHNGTASSTYRFAINSDNIQFQDGSSYNGCFLIAWKNKGL